jgi:uncharacterized ferredoxin-like protein
MSKMFAGPEDTDKMAYKGVLDVANHVIHAIKHAPQVTSRIDVKTAIVTGDDLLPIIEFLEAVGEEELVLWMDGMTYRKAYEEGKPPVLLLIGSDLTTSASGWDCGACGFATCAEFNKYSKLNRGMGLSAAGPSCMLNALDMGIVGDYACAAASKYDIENRIHVSIGLSALYLNYLEDVSYILGLSLGPLEEFWYYNRPVFTERWTKEWNDTWWMDLQRTLFPVMFQTFSGNTHPPIKTYDKWWDAETQDFVGVTPIPEINEAKDNLLPKILTIVPQFRERVDVIKARNKAEEKGQ